MGAGELCASAADVWPSGHQVLTGTGAVYPIPASLQKPCMEIRLALARAAVSFLLLTSFLQQSTGAVLGGRLPPSWAGFCSWHCGHPSVPAWGSCPSGLWQAASSCDMIFMEQRAAHGFLTLLATLPCKMAFIFKRRYKESSFLKISSGACRAVGWLRDLIWKAQEDLAG